MAPWCIYLTHCTEDITTLSIHHEMAAAIAAEGYSHASENFGIAQW